MHKIIPLWTKEAPYTAQSPEQAQPSITEYKVEGSRGAVVVCPGGGYSMKAPHEGGPIAEMLNEAGVSAYVLDYRVAPCHHYAPVTDALRAIRVVRSLGFEKVGILGFSAGGNLTCSAATLYNDKIILETILDESDPIDRFSSRPDAFIPCYPVVDMFDYTHVGSRENLLGAHADDSEYRRKFSAQLNVTEDTPPAFLWHTASDGAVPVENSLMLVTALSAKNVPFELHVFPEGNHGLGLAEDNPIVSQWAGLCQKWIVSLGFGK